MYERYHIHTEVIPGRHKPVPKFLVHRADNCINCGKCERACVYDAHKRDANDPRKMAEPDSMLCKNCFRCVVECPQRALSIKVNEEFKALGNGVWTPVRVTTMWNEAENAKIPVLGAGYRGTFSGPGFDAMWTDMSEIVRPTRDGIHGREFISTAVDIGRKPSVLTFDEQRRLLTDMGTIVDLPVPFLLDVSRLDVTDAVMKGIAGAASELGTLLVLSIGLMDKLGGEIKAEMLVPIISGPADLDRLSPHVRMVEIEPADNWKAVLKDLKAKRPGLLVGIRLRSSPDLPSTVDEMAKEADVLHVLFEESGMDGSGAYARDAMRKLHKHLVSVGLRDSVTIISSGGLAAAEMVPKSIICGADAVTLERAMKVALGCHACAECGKDCTADVKNAPQEFARQRVTNLCSAWRDQMLEMLGAMGIREVRRIRGETGRAIFEEDAHRDAFSGIEGGAKVD
ncbi:MAG: glutamate synthase-related protein [Methanomassiliicoccales archaeon]|nr:glutamate synthase-related protein [Methanomassiliicoccales archaeon]